MRGKQHVHDTKQLAKERLAKSKAEVSMTNALCFVVGSPL